MKSIHYHYDRWVLISTLLLLGFSVIMVASASMVISDRQYHYPFHYLIHQIIYLLFGLGIIFICTRIPMAFWKKSSGYLLIASILLLLAVLIPGIGHVINGSRRWISLGVISLQVSETAKFAVLIYLASYLSRFKDQVQTEIKGFIKPMIILSIIALLLLMEPDFGAVTVISITFLTLLFIARVRLTPFLILFLLVVIMLSVLIVISPYRLERLTTFLNPWDKQYGPGYQLTQSLIAFGRGGIFGVGLGNSIQKLFYLPEARTDFIFAVIGEELGLIGELFLIALFTMLISRIFVIARRAQMVDDLFSAYVAFGFALWLSVQAMINIGVNTGVLPTKGLTLPFISYGGSSLLINCAVIGIVLRIFYEVIRDERWE